MSKTTIDVTGVGNAIVDVLANAEDAFLKEQEIQKGGMILIDEEQAAKIYGAMAPGVEVSGGSAANSIACIASLGGNGGFVGKVAKDALGDVFRHDLKSIGVKFEAPALENGPATGRCLVNVTPDAQRSMTTFLGAAGLVSPSDIDDAMIAQSAVTFFEGYLFEQPVAREAFIAACDAAKKAGRKTALTLSDSSVVERQHDALVEFSRAHVDILLANETEAATLFGSEDINVIAEKARSLASLTAVTLSEKGSILIPREGEIISVDAVKPNQLVDTTGAGDAYAAGLLFGIARNMPLNTAGAIGSLAASEVISHFGARPQQDLQELAKKSGLL